MNEYSFITDDKPLLPLYWLAIRLTSGNAYIYEFLDKSFEKIYTLKRKGCGRCYLNQEKSRKTYCYIAVYFYE
jgi:hypothetical protein